jgi:hypothetical protein
MTPAQRLAELRAAGWTFTYSPHSLFIAAEHPLGGEWSSKPITEPER